MPGDECCRASQGLRFAGLQLPWPLAAFLPQWQCGLTGRGLLGTSLQAVVFLCAPCMPRTVKRILLALDRRLGLGLLVPAHDRPVGREPYRNGIEANKTLLTLVLRRGFHTAALAAACAQTQGEGCPWRAIFNFTTNSGALPPLNMAAAWSIRSSLYSHHHFLMVPLYKHSASQGRLVTMCDYV